MQTLYKTEKVSKKVVWYTGSDTLKPGYALCYDRDNTTAVGADGTTQLSAAYASFARYGYVEKPASGNLGAFAGIVAEGSGKKGPCMVEILEPTGGVLYVFTEENCVAGSTWLTLKPDSYIFGGIGEGMVVAMAVQTVNRTSPNGVVQAIVFPHDYAQISHGIAAPTSTVRSFSPAIWETCPWELIQRGVVNGLTYFNDFIGNYVLANAQACTNLGEGVSGFTAATAGTTISMEIDEPYGVVSLNSTTDDQDAGICIGGGKNTAGQIVLTSARKFWLEARVKATVLTNDLQGIFVGLAEQALNATTALIGADDALADKDYVGFHHLAADGDTFDTVFNTAGGGTSPVTIAPDAVTIEADTYVNLGMYCDGTRLYFYKDGVVLADSVLLAATDFPDGEEMAFYFDLMNKGGEDASAQIDFVRFAQIW